MDKIKNVLLLGLLVFALSCTKSPVNRINEMVFDVSYKVDNVPLSMNNTYYVNKAGNPYNVTKLVYYISKLSFIKSDGSLIEILDYHYIDAAIGESNKFSLKDIPKGDYQGIAFNVGLDSIHNISGSLPVNNENNNMIWPDFMGGGYHFMKLEGYFKDSTGDTYGYDMHLGTNISLVPIKLYKNISVMEEGTIPIHLTMNINEWFVNPYTYDFNKDGNYIMGNVNAMKTIANNGIDIFNF
jgi:hypothetical protein